jgi:hypothetical protein
MGSNDKKHNKILNKINIFGGKLNKNYFQAAFSTS